MFGDDDNLACPICNGVLLYLGTLGKVTHLVCRHCGGQWSEVYDRDETATTDTPETPNAKED